ISVIGYIYHVSSISVGGVTHVSLHLPSNIQTIQASDTIQFTQGIPENLWPTASSNVYFGVSVIQDGITYLGRLFINPSNGSIQIYADMDGASFGGSSGGLPADIFVSWDLSSNV
ncbi:MAG TPA: hypothetical protein VN703_06565, partial [Candidatus Sulfopaludibacter sp.]|nr:hypothetical protein [Candidatus Sulfopaludibacter sp.]